MEEYRGKENSSKWSRSHVHSAYRCCIPALTGLGGVHSQVSAAENGEGGIRTPDGFRPYTTSNRAPSTTRTPLQRFVSRCYLFGERGIRTLGNAEHYTGFRVRLLRPLGHLSTYETKRIRTSDPQFRKLMLYPAELWSQMLSERGGFEPPDPGLAGQLLSREPDSASLAPLLGFSEREGFEPPETFASAVFKTATIDHSDISPVKV